MNNHLNGELKVIGMRGCEDFTAQVDNYLKQLRIILNFIKIKRQTTNDV